MTLLAVHAPAHAAGATTERASHHAKAKKPAPCHAKSASATQNGARLTVSPATCLKGRQTVTITGSGLKPNSPGGLAECNDATGEPTVSVEGGAVPVSCTNPLAASVETSSTGTLDTTFTIVTGITGPPARGTDTAGKGAMTDALRYPCPPTSAQIAAGATCSIAFGDAGGDQVSVSISFVPKVKASSKKAGSTLTPSIPIG